MLGCIGWRRKGKYIFNAFVKSIKVHRTVMQVSHKAHYIFLIKRVNIVKPDKLFKIQILSSITLLDIAIDQN